MALAAILALAGTGVAHAQQGTSPASQAAASQQGASASLPPVTVSASGLQLGANDMTTPVTVLEGDELVRRREATLGETLNSEPGITSSHFGAGASRPIIRGMDGPRVKVLSDGAELHDASTISPDHAVVSEPLLATQIEVLRGPSALLYGNGAVGGVVNVLDGKVPTAVPPKGVEGSAELRANTGAREAAGAFSLTGGTGNLAVHVEGVARDAGDYRVGKGWAPEGEPTRKVLGSFNRTDTGSVGLSWVGDRGYLGAAYTRQTAKYGLPGHNHSFEGCHTHGNSLHCGSHDHDEGEDDHDHDHDHEHGDVPVVDLRSERFDIRGELRNPFAGFSALRLRAGVTDYVHDEVEDGAISTTFQNKAYDTRVELQHNPIAGFKGVIGLQTSQRKFTADGEEAYVEPTITRKLGIFALEEYRLGDWRFEAALRHDRQTAEAQASGIERSHNGTSASLGAVWKFTPGYQVGTSFTRASRAPTAEELYAQGLHMATSTYERGNANLKSEISQNIDVSLKKTAGDTTFGVSVFRNRINNYIYGRTLDEVDGLQLLQYSQADATFTGIEGQVRQRINRNLGVTLFGDTVRARLADGGGLLPRIPATRAGIRMDANWQAWEGQVEWVQVARQNRVADFETATPGYGMLNLGVSYNGQLSNGSPWQAYLKANNLTDRLAYAHTSFIKNAAPLMGRNVTVGVKVAF
ncbi:MAG: TonB-dependent receptor [Gammaproteobacteria bacterium]|nr:TonB-dependent receptor [Gammaproteobacteria bacterium]MBU1504445.1 TonB-dependent receptor [Gammaproteobacteria bacterium]MBU2118953.1 TonB-dependent receptor [Gammaproteobacteria bacterium]MBU2171374.1 TonB-dependent receptor [Gammaproteobacteria bacterium]MBU2201203.1 TonB-dependent receptor [Gammaproteobacteria bacterium]